MQKQQYKALKPVGRWSKDQIIGDLPQSTIEKLLADGVIKPFEVEEKPKAKAKEVTTNG